jgi:hypothetical protein
VESRGGDRLLRQRGPRCEYGDRERRTTRGTKPRSLTTCALSGGSLRAFQFSVPEEDAIYAHVARQAEAAAEHIRRTAGGDPGQAADAAWAAADILHAAARALGNPGLRRLADSYARATCAGHGRILVRPARAGSCGPLPG